MSVVPVLPPRALRGRKGTRHTASTRWAAGILIAMVIIALIGPLVAPYPPDSTDLLATDAPPSFAHWLGTDQLGRDILSRILFGARASLLGPLVVVIAATVFGTMIALSAAWIGGRYDSAVGVLTDIALAFPGILLAILVVAFVGPGLWAPIIALSLANIPYCARLIRSAALAERSMPYIEALYVQGFRGVSISIRHLIPNLSSYLAAIATLTFGYSMVELAAISFLGLGVQPPDADWGTMVAQGQAGLLQGSPQQTLFAGAFIVVTVIAANILGESLADRSARRA